MHIFNYVIIKMEKGKKEISVDDVLNMVSDKTKRLISDIEREENGERIETVDSIINDIKGQKEQTKLNKIKFANEIKSGLGVKIKEKPNEIKVYVKPWYKKLGESIKNIFTKF